MKRIIFFLLLLPLFCLNILAQQGTVVITEVFYDTPYNEDTGLKKDIYNTQGVSENVEQHHNGEFIEFYNPTNQAIDMSDWRVETSSGTSTKILHRGHYSYKFPAGTVINPQGILVLAYRHVNTPNFTLNQLFPGIQQTANEQILYHGGEFYLSNRGHIVTLYNTKNQTIDFVSYRGEGRDNNFWQLQAANGRYYGQPNTIKWKSIQRYQILHHPTDGYMLRVEANFMVDDATPLQLPENAQIPDISDWVQGPLGSTSSQTTTFPAVGSLPGALDVSPTGAATYTVPIEVPAGIAGIQPSLSLIYNSQFGNGIAGWGFNIGGLSAITRVPRTIFSDGVASGIKYSAEDGYALDGNRLHVVGTYGADGMEYRTETETFARIYSSGNLNGAKSFEVHTKDGLIMRYGTGTGQLMYSVDSKPHSVQAWQLDEVEYPNGQKIVYEYENIGLCSYIKKITYGGNSIEFSYEPRKDLIPVLYVNTKDNIDRRLSKIECLNENGGYRKYRLEYMQDFWQENFSRLEKITLLNAVGEAFSPTVFEWGKAAGKAMKVEDVNAESISGDFSRQSFVSVDTNGDGLTDVWRFGGTQTTGKRGPGVAATAEQSYETAIEDNKTVTLIATNDKVRGSELVGTLSTGNDNKQKLVFASLGRDNRTILFTARPYDASFGISMELPSEKMPAIVAGDINNDGKTEIIYIEKPPRNVTKCPAKVLYINEGKTESVSFLDSHFNLTDVPEQLYLADFDGDGMLDLFVLTKKGYDIFYNNGGELPSIFIGSQGATTYTTIFSNRNKIEGTLFKSEEIAFISMGDFNGDGLTDFVVNKRDNNWRLYLNNGNKSFDDISLKNLNQENIIDEDFTSYNDSHDACFSIDFDADGKTDLIISDAKYKKETDPFSEPWGQFDGQHRILWYRSTGTGFEWVHTTYHKKDDVFAKHFALGDFNGDGINDLMYYGINLWNGDTETKWRLYTNRDFNAASNKITAITNGFNQKTTVEYSTLTDNTVYSRQDGATYPVVDIQQPVAVVRSITTNPQTEVEQITNYSYKGAKVHAQGKGFLGFGEITIQNSTLDNKTTIAYGYDETYFSPYIKKQTVEVAGTIVSEAEFTNAVHPFSPTRFLPYTSKSIERNLLTEVTKTTETVVDENGNITHQTVDVSGKGSEDVSEEIQSTTDYTYGYYNGNGQTPNRVESVESTTTYKGKEPYTVRQEFAYNEQGLLTRQTDLANFEDLKVITKYDKFNDLGLAKEKTVQYADVKMPALTTKYEYNSKGYLIETTNPLGQTESIAYNSNGSIFSTTDILGLETMYNYDTWGRRIKTTSPTGVTQESSLQWITNHPDLNLLYSATSKRSGEPDVTVYFDRFGREVRSETQNLSGNIATLKEYNEKGQLKRQSLPHFANETPQWTNYEYDNLGRTQKVEFNGQATTYKYTGRTVTATNPLGFTSAQTTDVAGNILTSEDALGNTVTYSYNSMGKPVNINAAGAVSEMTYDAAGRQETLTDPAAGLTSYVYNAAGELLTQTDARGKISEVKYDDYGRIFKKINEDDIITYDYDDDTGLLKSETADSGHRRSYEYDDFGRMKTTTERIAGVDYIYRYAYDDYGNIKQKTYPSGFAIKYEYENGEMKRIRKAADNSLIWELTAENSKGQATEFKWGNNIVTNYNYDTNGLLTQQKTGVLNHLEYEWEAATGNLRWRKDVRANQKEDFFYDELDRLTGINAENTIVYAPNGNIDYKSDAGTYAYDPDKLHAVTGITGNPNTIPLRKQEIGYNAYGKVQTIKEREGKGEGEGEGEVKDYLYITYGVDNQRIEGNWYQDGNLTQTKIYLGDYEIVIPDEDDSKEIHYIAAPTGLVAVMIRQNDTDKLYYACTDHLGSLTALVNEAGQVVERHSYDAWGRERNPDDWEEYVEPNDGGLLAYGYGYTGHEMLPEFGLINMNGRVYDPVLGRFLSPDNYVQDPFNPQNYNRFGYCINNPLRYTDPSGDFWIFPYISFDKGGISFGISFGIGFGKHFGISASLGYSTGDKSFTATAGVSFGPASAYIGYNTNAGFISGVGIGFGNLPVGHNVSIGTNILSIGLSYSSKSGVLSASALGFSVSPFGIDFNPSLTVGYTYTPKISDKRLAQINAAIDEKLAELGISQPNIDSETWQYYLASTNGSADSYTDQTARFDIQLAYTEEYFRVANEVIKSSTSIFTRAAAKNVFFALSVKTNAEFDIKNSTFSRQAFGDKDYAYYRGELWEPQDFGNYNYGFAAKSFGLSLNWAIKGAGAAQVMAHFKRGAPVDWNNTYSWFDITRDTNFIIRGYNHVWYKIKI